MIPDVDVCDVQEPAELVILCIVLYFGLDREESHCEAYEDIK